MSSQLQSVQMVSVEKAAELLDVSKSTIRRLIKSGQLPAVKIGAQVRIRLGDLLDLIKRAAGRPTKPQT